MEIPVKVSGTAARTGSVTFSMLFSVEVINAPRLGNVKMLTLEQYDGIMNPEEHLGLYKAQMYI